MSIHREESDRRAFLRLVGAGVLGAAGVPTGATAETKPMRGVFPIGQTPVTPAGQLDLESLQNQVRFCNRYRVHGFVWPQIASAWDTLSEQERRSGAEAILAAGKGGKTALVIGVQDKEGNIDQSVAKAQHAAQNGADAIISLPPAKADDWAMIDYYKTIGRATDLPLIVQTRGEMSVELVAEFVPPSSHHEMRERRSRQPAGANWEDPRANRRPPGGVLRKRRPHHDRRDAPGVFRPLPDDGSVRFLCRGFRSLACR